MWMNTLASAGIQNNTDGCLVHYIWEKEMKALKKPSYSELERLAEEGDEAEHNEPE